MRPFNTHRVRQLVYPLLQVGDLHLAAALIVGFSDRLGLAEASLQSL
jgi:hypothetical protein